MIKEAAGDDDLIEGASALHEAHSELWEHSAHRNISVGVEVCADDSGYSLCTWESRTLFSLHCLFH